MPLPKLIHFTEGGPYHGYMRQEFAIEWIDEFTDMLGGKNPCFSGRSNWGHEELNLEVTYEQTTNS